MHGGEYTLGSEPLNSGVSLASRWPEARFDGMMVIAHDCKGTQF